MVAFYRKKPAVVQAIQWTGDNKEDVFNFTNNKTYLDYTPESSIPELKLITTDAEKAYRSEVIKVGDYIIKDHTGEFFLCKLDIFKKTYESVGVNQE